MTGAASVEYFDEDDLLRGAGDPVAKYREQILPAKLAIERTYVETCSPLGDLRLLTRTLSRMFRT
jgi:lipopolysaccharide/colanic/teichoic acid biosynthesis glycosyltransferase